ncbi:hypothetical protein [Phenylobacterium sp.]|uniref:hypothetical protein n=1 Tax=Phenylobacterium sp. TaxID=1871053 RepID=UPI0027164B70|nr:hypothetical protein [Phenylobacterium sp.]MDO8801131.1 hypothetical protein [Phenylobacterium sp.]
MIRVLACMPHFFRRTSAKTSFNNGSNLETVGARAAQFSYSLRQLVAILEETQFHMGSPDRIAAEEVRLLPKAASGDVVVVSQEGENLLAEVSNGNFVEHVLWDGPPRELGYHCRRVFAERAGEYDLYCFIEDDTAILDPAFFQKVAAFHAAFGDDKILLPNRFEIMGVMDGAWRAYLDAPVFSRHRTPNRPGPDELSLPNFDGAVRFTKSTDSMSGCYVITDAQLRSWMTMPDFQAPLPYWIDRGDDPMEITQIPMAGRLPIYRPAPENIGFLEVHHVPNGMSKSPGPYPKVLNVLGPLVEERRRRRSARREAT